MTTTIKVTIDGSRARVEVDGMAGGECKEATAAIEEALGITKGTSFKPEFYQAKEQGEGRFQ